MAPVVTLGNFDGLHIGHLSVLKRLVSRAREIGSPSVLYTFDPHPLKIVAPDKSPSLITDTEDKRALVEAAAIDYLVMARFTTLFASKHPREFVRSVLVDGLGAREVWVGRNYSFGRGRAGTVESLKKFGSEFGFKVVVVAETRRGNMVVSSSRIRALVKDGEASKAAKLLGRPYSIKGRVVRGFNVGRKIGFPTANIEVSSELLPRNGVYAAKVALGARSCRAVLVNNGGQGGESRQKEYDALVNIGNAPTFKNRKHTVEAHLLNFNRGIYGRRMRVSFLTRLRDEVRFGSKEELASRIELDLKMAEKIFK